MIELPIVVPMKVETDTLVFTMKCESTFQPSVGETYTGDYTVIPLARNDVVLETARKLCTDDITVKKIPTYETRNDYGLSFYIAEV